MQTYENTTFFAKQNSLLLGIFFSFFCLFWSVAAYATENLRIERVRIEGRENPMGINTLTPSFSWQLHSDGHDVLQTAYRINVSTSSDFSEKQTIWDSDWISTDQSLYNPYKGPALLAGKTYYLRVRVKDNKGHQAQSAVQHFHTGLLSSEDWSGAQWIAKDILPDSLVNPLPLSSSKLRIDKSYDLPVFRKSVQLKKKIKSSIAYISGLGHYELLLNGRKVDDAVLQPGWTKYDKEAYYVVYDLTQQWRGGKNTFAVLLGNGFYYIPPIKGRFQKHKVAFGLPKLKMKVVNTFADGTEEVIISDTS